MLKLSEVILHYSHICALICSFLFNTALCLCVVTEKRQQLRLYSNVLIIQCATDIISGIFYYITAARFLLVDGVFYLACIQPWFKEDYVNLFGVNLPSNYLGFYLYLVPIGLPIAMLPLSFYFRYLQVCR